MGDVMFKNPEKKDNLKKYSLNWCVGFGCEITFFLTPPDTPIH